MKDNIKEAANRLVDQLTEVEGIPGPAGPGLTPNNGPGPEDQENSEDQAPTRPARSNILALANEDAIHLPGFPLGRTAWKTADSMFPNNRPFDPQLNHYIYTTGYAGNDSTTFSYLIQTPETHREFRDFYGSTRRYPIIADLNAIFRDTNYEDFDGYAAGRLQRVDAQTAEAILAKAAQYQDGDEYGLDDDGDGDGDGDGEQQAP